MQRLVLAAALTALSAAALAAPALAQEPAKPAASSNPCFRMSQIDNHTKGDDQTLYLSVRHRDVYRLGMSVACLAGASSSDPLVMQTAGGSDLICRPLDLDLSVEANLVFHARLHGIGGAQAKARIADALARLGLAERRGDRVRELSGGNRRKVELARALVHQPSVLLMDEATVGLDPASRRHLLDEVLGLRASGVGVLWASHLVDEAEAADRVLVLHKGELLAQGTPAELVAASGCDTLAEAFLKMTRSGQAVEPA